MMTESLSLRVEFMDCFKVGRCWLGAICFWWRHPWNAFGTVVWLQYQNVWFTISSFCFALFFLSPRGSFVNLVFSKRRSLFSEQYLLTSYVQWQPISDHHVYVAWQLTFFLFRFVSFAHGLFCANLEFSIHFSLWALVFYDSSQYWLH